MAMCELPDHREATALEFYIYNTIKWLADIFDDLSRDTPFEYWLLDPRGQRNTMFHDSSTGYPVLVLVCPLFNPVLKDLIDASPSPSPRQHLLLRQHHHRSYECPSPVSLSPH